MKVRELTSEEIMSTLELPTAMLFIFDEADESRSVCGFSNNVAVHMKKSCSQYSDDQYTFMGFIDGNMTIVRLLKENRSGSDWQRVRVIYGDASMVAARLTARFVECGVCASAEAEHDGSPDEHNNRTLHNDAIIFYVFDEELLK